MVKTTASSEKIIAYALMQVILNAVPTVNPGELIILNQNSMRVAREGSDLVD